jgi:5-methylcytosine-specific restriction endonuclease McrA
MPTLTERLALKKKSNHRVFMRRTASIFRHQKDRAAAAGQQLNYGITHLRFAAATLIERGCPFCLTPVTTLSMSFDHIQPVSRGGSFDIRNVHGCCAPCNQTKGELTAIEFRDLLFLIATWPTEAQRSIRRRLRAGGRFPR